MKMHKKTGAASCAAAAFLLTACSQQSASAPAGSGFTEPSPDKIPLATMCLSCVWILTKMKFANWPLCGKIAAAR